MNVLVYSGQGTTNESVKHCLESLRYHLSPYYAVVTINEQALLHDPWQFKSAALVIPGGADLPYCQLLNGAGTKKITQFVRKGGKYIGLCAGGYFGSSRIEWEVGTNREVSGPRELKFFQGTNKGCAYKGFDYDNHDGARVVKLQVNSECLPNCPSPVEIFYNGGGLFSNASKVKDCTILARYAEETDIDDDDRAAVVLCKLGNGNALLSGPHPEFSPSLMKPRSDDTHFIDITKKLAIHEPDRKIFFKECLKKLGLKVNEDTDVPRVPKLSPIYLSSHLEPSKVVSIYKDLQQNLPFQGNSFQDENDKFIFHQEADAIQYIDDHCDELEDLNAIAKHINICDQGSLPDSKMTPFFSMNTYFNNLTNFSNGKVGAIGSVLGYGEVVTSTNTMLDKNPAWLARLPHGFTFTTSTQVAGRGRGGNVWVNPRGVLATSVLFRMPQGCDIGTRVATLQYLCSIALIESILGYGLVNPGSGNGYEDMPLKLKWPNDIYILKPEYFEEIEDKNNVSSTVEGDDAKWVKVSGALVNTQYLDGHYNLVWGAGVNVSNEAPTTSLNLVLSKLNTIRAKKGKSELASYQIEILLAKIMANLNNFYDVFKKSGLNPFLPLYYKRWFHNNQTVLLDQEGSGSTIKVEIKGITQNGLLVAQNTNTKELYELQPDGNSFDIFKGLVYRKK